MKPKIHLLLLVLVGLCAATPVLAQRGHAAYGAYGGHYRHDHARGPTWGPFGFLLGTAILYSAMQPRTVYYEPAFALPPPYAPAATVYLEQNPAPPVQNVAPPPRLASGDAQESAAGQWWYFCKKPAGYYPYIRACPIGWERVSPTPPGIVGR